MHLDASTLPLGFLEMLRIFPPWLVTWWLPLSLVGIGVLFGFAALLALWGIGAVLSRVPVLGHIAEDRRLRLIALPIATGVALLVSLLLSAGYLSAGFEQSLGVGLGYLAFLLVVLLPVATGVGMAAITIVSRRTVAEVPLAIREGVLMHMTIVLLILAVVGILAPLMVEDPGEILTSLARWPFTGTTARSVELPPPVLGQEPPEKAVEIAVRGDEVDRMTFKSDQPLEVSLRPFAGRQGEADEEFSLEIKPDEDVYWVKGSPSSPPLPEGEVRRLYVRNLGEGAADVSLTVDTAPRLPEVAVIPVTALCVLLLYLFYLVQRSWMPRLSAVALATSMSEVANPLFLILVGNGAFLLLIFLILPFNTFGEDIKMLKTTGLQLVLVLCIIEAVWAAGTSVSDEIEGKTALTVLSKPLNRIQFILGKFLGIVWTVALMFMILGLVFLFVVAYKPIYDGNEAVTGEVTWQQCYGEMIRIVPGLALAFMETVVLTAISVAISTRLSMLANFSICFGIYVLGHLTPLIVKSSAGDLEPVAFVGQLLAVVLPVLDHFSIEAAITGGADVPLEYLGWAMLYCLMFVTLAMLLALVLFEDRDVA